MSRKVAYYGIFSCLALIMGYVETLIPLPAPAPGIKLGLANVIVLIALYTMGTKDGLMISLVRVFLSGLLFSGFSGLMYSLAGSLVSFAVMVLAEKAKVFSIVGVSVLGGVAHNFGQLLVAGLVVENARMVYYLPVLAIFGVAAGFLTGWAAKFCIPYINRKGGLERKKKKE